jgi:queuine tRNA-ribosyltransferase
VLTPERAIEIQGLLGSDIQMQLDECVKLPASDEVVEKAMRLSLRWAERCRIAFGEQPDRAMFGIVQGGAVESLRVESAKELVELDLKGYAIGGLAVGEPQDVMLAMIETVEPHLPAEKPRYLMGVGTPDDIVEAVRRGVDMFDCVMPTRHARNGQLFTFAGRLNIRGARYREDPRPPDPDCRCPTCRRSSRAYLRHLHQQGDPLYGRLATIHNLYFFHQWVGAMRQALRGGSFDPVAQELSRVITEHYADAGAP